MADYIHGAYGEIIAIGEKTVAESQAGMIFVGTAPVHLVSGGASNVNKPIVINNMTEARAYLGYSEDFAAYTLCEAMHIFLDIKRVAPIIMINVLDPVAHKAEDGGTVSKTPENGRVTIPEAESIILDSVVVKAGNTAKVLNKDYTLSYSFDKQTLTIRETSKGSLGTTALTITYDLVDATLVETEDIIGSTDGLGKNTGLFAIKDVYQLTGYIPSFLGCPGWSSIPSVHTAMAENTVKINKHWDAYMFTDIPLIHEGETLNFDTAKTFKNANGYNKENETTYFPLALGVDGRKYHISVLAMANFLELLKQNEGIPYHTASNTLSTTIENLYLGEDMLGRIFDDSIINEKLNRYGINSAAYISGSWRIWGAHASDYDHDENETQINVAETTRMMLYYISNDFQHRRTAQIDQPLTPNDIKQIVAEEQTRLDALLNIGALTYGEVHLRDDAKARRDIRTGDYAFMFNVTTTPLAKSLTAYVTWTDEGFATYFE